MSTPLVATNSRVKEARKLSRRSVRTERRLFLADGPKAVEGALSVDGCVVEVFATPAALEHHADLLAGATVTLVDERALASLSDSVSPAGVVALCHHIDAPLDGRRHRLDSPAGDLRRRARPGQRGQRDPYGGRRRRRRSGPRRPVRGRLQPQDGPQHGRQPVPPALRGRGRPGHRGPGRPGAWPDRARRRRLGRGRPVRGRPGGPDGVALRQRGVGPAAGARGTGRPPRRHPDPRPRREPQPLHRRGRVPLRQRPGAART